MGVSWASSRCQGRVRAVSSGINADFRMSQIDGSSYMCSDLDICLVVVACLLEYSKGMCNELRYNAFRNNAANIRHVKSYFMSTIALVKRETFFFLCDNKKRNCTPSIEMQYK